jgi:ABC-2 type transport system ATP-binding protein
MNALEINQLTKIYPNGVQAVKNISLQVPQGDFFALLGPNGAGKSTVISIISSLLVKTSGQVRVFGHDLDQAKDIVKRHIGLVPQEFNFNIFETVEQILINQAGFYGIPLTLAKEKIEYYLNALGLWGKRKEKSGSLSGGMKRRLLVIRALVHEPPLLILDEPTAGVDIELRRIMWDFLLQLNANGTTIILTTHYLEEAENLCRHIAIINEGQVIAHRETKFLLQQLHTETFLFYLKDKLTMLPYLPKFAATLVDEFTLAIDLTAEQSLNEVFATLTALGITVMRMRNKSNRLEELFLKLVNASAKDSV